jgi:CHAT domain-containing protein
MLPNTRRRLAIPRLLGILFLCSLTCCLWLGHVDFATQSSGFGEKVNAQTSNQLVQEGVERYQAGDLTGAIALWEKALKEEIKKPEDGVIVRENLARTYQQTGKMTESLKNWDQAIAYYLRVGNMKMLGRSKAEQAQVYNNIGQPEKALNLLCNLNIKTKNCAGDSAVQIAYSSKDVVGEVTALGILGDTHRLRGNYQKAVEILEQSLQLAKKDHKFDYIASINHSLGNAHNSLALLNYSRADLAREGADTEEAESEFIKKAEKEDDAAITSLKQSRELAKSQKNYQQEIQVLQTLIPIYYRNKNINHINQGKSDLQEAINLLVKLPENQTRAYAAINLARFIQNANKDGENLRKYECVASGNFSQAESLLNQAVMIAQKIGDSRAESFAQGQLGHIYECRREYKEAQEFTRKAQLAAQQGLDSADSLYLWQWQAGRILKQQGNIQSAINDYDKSLKTLDTIRQDILTANRDIQFDFRDTIEPIYRDLVEMRLTLDTPLQISSKSSTADKSNPENNNVGSALNTIDGLRLAELQNYFGNNCNINDFIPKDGKIPEIKDDKTAVISTVVFDDRTAVILSLPLPNQSNKYKWYEVKREELNKKINNFRLKLQDVSDNYDLKISQDIYNWMIAPFQSELDAAGINKLVFIHDGILRSVPMSALHDGKKYLIEKYAIATTPSLKLSDSKPLSRRNLRVLALGLSQKAEINGKSFRALDGVTREVEGVVEKIPGKKLVNELLTQTNLKQKLKQEVYSILHIATHGKFGTDPENTFIVMGKEDKDKGDNQILKFNELDRLIRETSRNREPLEILTLTACETATGNNRSALGLAGIAVQAGAKTAIASLWSLGDEVAVIFANDFYEKLISNPKMGKAEILQSVQKSFLQEGTDAKQYNHPGYWAPLVMIGNWI